MQMSQMSFEIKKVGSNEKITSIEAGSFKAAISEFAKSYDINEIDKYCEHTRKLQINFLLKIIAHLMVGKLEKLNKKK